MKDIIVEIEISRIQAILKQDMEVLWRIHSEDYQLISPFGRIYNRDSYLAAIDSGSLKYRKWVPKDFHIRSSKNMSILRYQVTLQVEFAKAPEKPLDCWHTDSYEKTDDSWKIVWSQATLIG